MSWEKRIGWQWIQVCSIHLRKPLTGGQRENTKVCSCPYSHLIPLQSRSYERSSPTTIFFCSHGPAKNVIKSASVFCHTAWTVGSLAFSMESSIVFSCYWTRIKYGFACSFLCTNSVCLFTRPDWRPSLTLLLASASYWAHVKGSSSREGRPICSIMIFRASVEAWAFSGWTGKDLGSGTGVTCPIIINW